MLYTTLRLTVVLRPPIQDRTKCVLKTNCMIHSPAHSGISSNTVVYASVRGRIRLEAGPDASVLSLRSSDGKPTARRSLPREASLYGRTPDASRLVYLSVSLRSWLFQERRSPTIEAPLDSGRPMSPHHSGGRDGNAAQPCSGGPAVSLTERDPCTTVTQRTVTRR